MDFSLGQNGVVCYHTIYSKFVGVGYGNFTKRIFSFLGQSEMLSVWHDEEVGMPFGPACRRGRVALVEFPIILY